MINVAAMPIHADQEDKDVLRFSIGDDSRDIVLTEDNGSADIKALFEWLLVKMIDDEVSISYVQNPDYHNEMYASVCEQYVLCLESELDEVRCRMLKECLISE